MTAITLALVAGAMGLLFALTVRQAWHLQEARAQVARLGEFERLRLMASGKMMSMAQGSMEETEGRRQVIAHLERLAALSVGAETPVKLKALRIWVQRPGTDGSELMEAVELFHHIATTEQEQKSGLLAKVERASTERLALGMAVPLAVIAVGLALFPLARRRVIKPIEAFGHELDRLARGEFSPAPVDDRVAPFLLPLHRQYNELVRRLAELEAAHRQRAATLEAEVRAAAGQLLEQQRGLARAERLAATGELAASVAHELRNPLAGLRMSLSNLRAELHDADLLERADLMIGEVDRLTRLLNELLDSARHAPEPARPISLAALVADMFGLLRYQLSPGIELRNDVDPKLTCRLPQDHLRQALLNLVLNAAAAIGDRPGRVTVGASINSRMLRMEVSDDGPGFPAEYLGNGIRPFFSTRERGTGLGLAMVRRFARDLGGALELANRPQGGACATLVLPAEGEQASGHHLKPLAGSR